MSGMGGGPGWFRASDGRWYPTYPAAPPARNAQGLHPVRWLRGLSTRDRLVVGGLTVVFASLIVAAVLNRSDTISPTDLPGLASTACQMGVRRDLKVPSTASFDADSGGFGAAEPTGVNTWRAVGAVDAQNGFGAKVRSAYSCDVIRLPDHRWQVTNVNVSAP